MTVCGHCRGILADLAYSVTAQRLYEAFAQYGPLFRGLPLAWDQLDDETQAAWIAAARAI